MKQVEIKINNLNYYVTLPMQAKIYEPIPTRVAPKVRNQVSSILWTRYEPIPTRVAPKVRNQVSSILWTRYNGGYSLQRPI